MPRSMRSALFALILVTLSCQAAHVNTNNANPGPTVTAPSLSPTSLAFGSQNVGTRSAAQSVTLANSGSGALTVSGVTVTGNYVQTNNCPATLAVNASCTIQVTFSPSTTGSLPGQLSISDNPSGSAQSAALSGTGTAPDVSLSPTSLAFGSQNVGATSAAQSVTLANSGSGALTVSGVAVTSNYVQTNNCPATLAVNASCTIQVTFSPSTTGSLPGQLSISDNASGSTQSAALSGTGVITVTAASCSVSDVQSALNQAQDGYTVAIPAGTCTWTSTLTVSTAINMVGSGAGTVIIDNVDKSNCHDNPAIDMEISANLPWRLANFTLQGSAPDAGGCSEHIKVVTNSHSVRLDHITFTNMTTTGIFMNGDVWGVVDHSTFNGNFKRGVVVHHGSWQQVGLWGDNSWAQPDTMGTEAAVYVENNTFNITGASGAGSVACDDYGARVVARYNALPYLGTHGLDSGQRARACRHFEVYNNTITDNGSTVSQGMQLRGGTALFFNNTIIPTAPASYAGPLALEIYREVDSWTPWGPASNAYKGGCDGTSPFDDSTGNIYDSGTAGSASTTDSLNDTTKSWTTNQWAGYSLRDNTTGPWGASIQSNTATTITTYASSMGFVHSWNANDSYQILKVYPCLDQPGWGQGGYLSGGGFTTPPTPTGWPNQAIDPVYAWNNTENGALVPVISAYYTHIQANRDYYDWNSGFNGTTGVGAGLLSAMPATCTPLVAYWATDTNTLYQCATANNWVVYYTPYIYPHPLTLSPPF